MNRLDKNLDKFKRFKNIPGNKNTLCSDQITKLYFDSNENLWIGTENGLSIFDPTQNQFTNCRQGRQDIFGLVNNNIRAIWQDSRNTMWIGTDGGLSIRFANNNRFVMHVHDLKKPESLSENLVRAIYEDHSGIVWIGTYGGGINKYDRQKNSFIHFKQNPLKSTGLIDNNIWSFCEDKKGFIWIGTNNGINKYDPHTDRFELYAPENGEKGSLNHKIIRTVCEDHYGNIWCGTDGGGLNVYDRKLGRFFYFKHDPSNPGSLSDDKIRHIFEDKDKNLWIATWNGLDRFDRNKKTFVHFKHDPADSSSLSDNRVRTIFEDRDGYLWIGTYGGLNLFDKSSGTFRSYIHDLNNKNSISGNRILCILKDGVDRLWIGTFQGLNLFNREQETFSTITVKDGLPNDVIYGIVEDGLGNLWMSTNKGLAVYNPDEKGDKRFKSFDVYDGLQSDEFNGGAYLKSKNGEIYFGGINGFNKFSPENVTENTYVPPIVLTAFKKFDKSSTLNQSITEIDILELSYKDNFFSFEFAALDFTNPAKNQYVYKLEGFDTDWIECGNRRYASYTNLDGGEYVFRVKGSNNDHIWNEQGTSINIIITPPYWNTWWFRILSAFLILAIGFGYYRFKTAQSRRQREILKIQVEERTQELKASNKRLQKTKKEAQRLAIQTRLLYDVGIKIGKELDLDSVLDNVVNNARDAFDYYGVMLFLVDKKRNGLVLKSIAGGYKDVFPKDLFLKAGIGLTSKSVKTKETQLSNDVLKNNDYYRGSEEATRSELCVPIISGDEVIGVLDMQSDKVNSFSDSDVEVAETFSLQIASAINNARLYDKAQKEISERKRAENKLHESKEDLENAKKETDNIFRNVEEGLCLLNKKGEISAQYSNSLETIFNEKDLGHKKLTSIMNDKIPDNILTSFSEYLDLMFKNEIDEDVLVELNPISEIEIVENGYPADEERSKYLVFKFKRISNNKGKITQVIATIFDITQSKRLAKQLEQSEAEQKKQIEWMMSILHVEPVLLKEFIDSAKRELNYISDILRQKDAEKGYINILQNIYRSMHLIKGNAGLLDLQFFEKKAHTFEEDVQKIQKLDKIKGTSFITLVIQLEDMRKMMIELDSLIDKLGNLHNQIRPKREYENKLFIQSLRNLITSISKDYNKKVIFDDEEFNVEHIPFEYRLTVKEILIHLLRNSVYHGIELPAIRSSLKKDPQGLIHLKSKIGSGFLMINLKDDGKGLQIDKLYEKAKEIGRWDEKTIKSWDKKQIVNLIFEAGITTSDTADLVAGRGVGMEVIKERIDKLKGHIDFNYEENKFCEFILKIPLKKKK